MHKRKRRAHREVELNLAAMLDMAFQLLAFFILTFQPIPIEGGVRLRLPSAQAVAGDTKGRPGNTPGVPPVDNGTRTLTIRVSADPRSGAIAQLALGDTPIDSLPLLEARLREVFADVGNPFDQVLVQVSDNCRYDELMRVVEACTKQKMSDGKTLPKLSFVELPNG